MNHTHQSLVHRTERMSTALTTPTADGRIVDGFISLLDSVDREDSSS